jgi:large subunit ribosomal protein L7/L12
MATKEERLKALEKKQAQIQKQIQALKARDTAQERKNDTRRKVLIGGFVLAQMKKNGIGVQSMVYESERFIDTLKNDRDRSLFGLAETTALSPTGEAGGAVVFSN